MVGELITPTGVLVMTAGQMRGDRAGWLKARRWREMPVPYSYAAGYRIGSSDVPSLFDLDGVDTPAHVYADKVRGVERVADERMQMGQEAEPFIAGRWTRVNRCVTDEIGLVAHAEKPWHQTTIDRRVRECPTVKGLTDGCGLEVKNVGLSTVEKWASAGDGLPELPDRIITQVLHQLYVTGYPHMHIAVWVGGNQPRQYIIYADRVRKYIDTVVRVVDAFRDEHLLTGVEPEWNVMNKPAKMLELDKMLHPERVGEIGLDDIGLVMEYARLSRIKGDADKAMKRVQAQLAQIASGARYLTFANELAFGFRPQSKETVDRERLRERWPDAAADVIGETSYVVAEIGKDYRIKPTKPEKE